MSQPDAQDGNAKLAQELAAAQTPEPLAWADHLERLLCADHDGDSHTETDPRVFHPSQLARCKRQATISKCGLETHDADTLGIFKTGTLIHEWLEAAPTPPGVEHEVSVQTTFEDGDDYVLVTGHADAVDGVHGVVYDFKTRGGWYNFDPPVQRHIDQLQLYMAALGYDAGQVVYVNKKDLGVRTWPDGTASGLDSGRVAALVEKARAIRDALREAGPVESREAVPFEPCGCWLCEQEGESV